MTCSCISEPLAIDKTKSKMKECAAANDNRTVTSFCRLYVVCSIWIWQYAEQQTVNSSPSKLQPTSKHPARPTNHTAHAWRPELNRGILSIFRYAFQEVGLNVEYSNSLWCTVLYVHKVLFFPRSFMTFGRALKTTEHWSRSSSPLWVRKKSTEVSTELQTPLKRHYATILAYCTVI